MAVFDAYKGAFPHAQLTRSCNCLPLSKRDCKRGWQSISTKLRSGNDLSATEKSA
jgi:hypothetical protein